MSAIQFGGASGAGGTSDAFGALGSDEFLQIILTELTSQDPLSPNDTSALLDQISTIRSIESDIALGDRLDAIVTENSDQCRRNDRQICLGVRRRLGECDGLRRRSSSAR